LLPGRAKRAGSDLSSELFDLELKRTAWSIVACCHGAGRVAKDFTALGGKVGSAGPGVETEQRERVEVRGDGVKLLTLGVGKVDKDAVLQAGKAEIDRLKAASQEIVFKVLNIVGSLGGGGVETPRLGLVKKIVNEMNELAARLGNFSNHNFIWRVAARRVCRPDPILPCIAAARRALGDVSVERSVLDFQWRKSPRDGRSFLPSTGSEKGREKASGGL
jgi:hypothetical protein